MTNEQQQEALDGLSEAAKQELFARFLARVKLDGDLNQVLTDLLLEVRRDFRS